MNLLKKNVSFTEPDTLFAYVYEPVREKINNLGSDQVRYKPGCTVTEDG